MAKMTNPLDGRQMRRLVRAIQHSRQEQRPFREQQLRMVKAFVGANYGENGADRAQPTPLTELAVNIYKRHLIAKEPQVLITSDQRGLRFHAETFGMAVNRTMEEMDIQTAGEEVVMNAIFSVGIMKLGITGRDMGEEQGFLHDAGQTYADPVLLDDWVHDMSVRRYEQVQFSGNRYTMDWERFEASSAFDSDNLSPTISRSTNEQGDERLEQLSRESFQIFDSQFRDTIELWDIWLPMEQLVVTFATSDHGEIIPEPAGVHEFDGTERGPFHILSFNKVPGNIMPLAPVVVLQDLHELGNTLFRKLRRQAERQKDNTAYHSSQEDDAQRLIDSNDGEAIRFDGDPRNVIRYRSGGIDQATLAFFLQVKDLFFQFGGNLDALGGLSPQADTLGQDELLTSSASKRMEDMQERTTRFFKGVSTDIAKYLWHDPAADMVVTKQLPNSTIKLRRRFRGELMEGDFIDFNFEIAPQSMTNRTPAQRLRTIMNTMNQIVFPLLPIMQQQGITIDINALLDTVAKYTDTPELRFMLNFSPVLNPDTQGGGEMRQSPSTTRTNVRVNRPGATRAARDNTLSRVLSGGGAQPSETQALSGPIG